MCRSIQSICLAWKDIEVCNARWLQWGRYDARKGLGGRVKYLTLYVYGTKADMITAK